MIEILFLPILLFMAYPLIAFVLAALFALLGYWMQAGSRKVLIVAAVIWTAYGMWESYMWFWSKTVIAPIRVDLFLITPVLYIVTIIAFVRYFQKR